jgi:glycosyltransferase involved in cell wall biosynthesis
MSSKKIKVCHLITRMILGGAQENTLLTLQGLRRDTNWEIHLAYGPEGKEEGSLLKECEALGVVLHPLKFLRRNLNLLDDVRAFYELEEYFLNECFDLVHTHSSKAGVLGRIAAARAGVPHIVHTIHGLAFDEYQPTWKNWIYTLAEKIAAEHCDLTIGVCKTMIDFALAHGIGTQKLTQTIYSGFPIEAFLELPSCSSTERFRIGMIARMFRLKGHEDLMQLAPLIMKRWSDVDLLVVGDGPMRPEWDKWLKTNLQWKNRIHFSGRVKPEEIPSQIAQMNLLLHLSWREGLARTIPQALASARPVCAYDIGGAAEVIEENRTGWVVRPGDFETILNKIEQLRNDRTLGLTMGQKGREKVKDLFSEKVMQLKILNAYLELGLSR